jgi:hypothetical protein
MAKRWTLFVWDSETKTYQKIWKVFPYRGDAMEYAVKLGCHKFFTIN